MLRRGPLEDKRLYLTFDDGPDPVWTPRVLDILAAAGARAAFFVVGTHARAHPDLLRRIAGQGHEIGNHTGTHRHPWTLPPSAARREVRDGADAIADITGIRPLFYRPPHGRLRRCMAEEAQRAGQAVVLWSLSAVDWGPLGSARGIFRRLGKADSGDIVLMHDGGRGPNKPEHMTAVLPAFLDAMAHRRLAAGSLQQALPAGARETG
jgi:peptidoglycan/xylan/chitin deacetylase (PgdA/CDA1 family)